MITDQWIGSSAAPLGIPHVGVTVESVLIVVDIQTALPRQTWGFHQEIWGYQ